MGWCNDSLQSEDVGCVGSTQGCTGLIGVKALNSPSDWEQCLQDVGWCNTLLQSEAKWLVVRGCGLVLRPLTVRSKVLVVRGCGLVLRPLTVRSKVLVVRGCGLV